MILEFDLGNTASKWRLLDTGTCLLRGAIANFDEIQLPAGVAVERVRVASVAAAKVEQALADWCMAELQLIPEFARSVRFCAGVTNIYAQPERLGVDRWLALLAAHNQFACGALIIDAGTAMTVDYVDVDGRHLGGYILPGLQLSQQALLKDTSKVNFSESVAFSLAPGESTAEAVVHGAAFSACASVLAAWRQAGQVFGNSFEAILTGGDAPKLLSLLGSEAGHFRLESDIVFDGLAYALP